MKIKLIALFFTLLLCILCSTNAMDEDNLDFQPEKKAISLGERKKILDIRLILNNFRLKIPRLKNLFLALEQYELENHENSLKKRQELLKQKAALEAEINKDNSDSQPKKRVFNMKKRLEEEREEKKKNRALLADNEHRIALLADNYLKEAKAHHERLKQEAALKAEINKDNLAQALEDGNYSKALKHLQEYVRVIGFEGLNLGKKSDMDDE